MVKYLVNFCCLLVINLTCWSTVYTDDPLKYIKDYYYQHVEFQESRIPIATNLDFSYDFIIIGAGSAGSVLANRLSEVPHWKILLLEAGVEGDFITDIPLLNRFQRSSEYDWNYKIEPQKNCARAYNGTYEYPRGKVLGGSSTINGMLYMRGNKMNFEKWKALGNRGWGYRDVLKYFKKSEDIQIQALRRSPYHAINGRLKVGYANYSSGLYSTFFEAVQEFGYNVTDYNGANQTGYSIPQFNMVNGKRCGGTRAFLKPVASRSNLDIATGVLVTKILINRASKVAHAVEIFVNNRTYIIHANNEIIVSGGTINTPQLLMLSGIGPRQHLESLQIPVIQNLPVGFNMLDHVGFGMYDLHFNFTKTLTADMLSDPRVIEEYFVNASGPLSSSIGIDALAFVKTKFARSDRPDVELLMTTNNIQFNSLKNDEIERSFSMLVLLFEPESAGRVKLRSKNPMEQPSIDTNCFDSRRDVEGVREGIKLAMKVARTKAFAKYNTTINPTPYPGCENITIESDEYWECAIRQVGSTMHHQVGTCKMGPASDPTAVVDPRLRVHGVHDLRVVDASIMPTMPAAHPNAIVYMIAEKAADMIKEDWSDYDQNYQYKGQYGRRKRSRAHKG